jgi:hypothetical protein
MDEGETILDWVVNPVATAVIKDCLGVITKKQNHLATGSRLHFPAK